MVYLLRGRKLICSGIILTVSYICVCVSLSSCCFIIIYLNDCKTIKPKLHCTKNKCGNITYNETQEYKEQKNKCGKKVKTVKFDFVTKHVCCTYYFNKFLKQCYKKLFSHTCDVALLFLQFISLIN